MWQPTHVKVTVRQAKDLLTKGKHGTNDAFVVIGIGKEKYQTSTKEKASPNVEWKEECELSIPSQGNKANIQLTIYHHNSLGLDEFLGQVGLPLTEFDVYEKPKYRSYKLKGKPDKDKKKGEKERGELELMVQFTVKSGSHLDISKKEKHKSSLTSLKHLGGSLMSIGGGKDKNGGLKNFARSVSSKMDKIAKPHKGRKSKSTTNEPAALSNNLMSSKQAYGQADPGVISDDEDDEFRFDEDIKVNNISPQSTMSRGSSLMQDTVLEAGETREKSTFDEKHQAISPLKSSDRITSFSESNKVFNSTGKSLASDLGDLSIREESSLELKSTLGDDDESDDLMKSYNQKSKSVGSSSKKSEFYTPTHSETLYQTQQVADIDYEPQDLAKNFTVEGSYNTSLDREEDSALGGSVGPDDMSSQLSYRQRSSSNASSAAVSSSISNSGTPLESREDLRIKTGSPNETSLKKQEKTLVKSSSARDVTMRGSLGNKRGKKVVSATESFGFDASKSTANNNNSNTSRFSGDFSSPHVIRSGSLSEKRSSVPVADEWERKLYGPAGMTGSNENMSMDGSRTSLNSRSSSTHDIRRDDSFSRLPEVKALTLEREIKEEDGNEETEVPSKQKRKGFSGFKKKFFNSKSGGSREILNEDRRIVEGGNDRLPSAPTRSSKLPQEIHNKFSGQSREDLLETILTLQGNLERQLKHNGDLENYIDDLLLRVMDANPSILQAPMTTKSKSIRRF